MEPPFSIIGNFVWRWRAALTLISLCTVYLLGLPGEFILDDIPQLLENPALNPEQFNLEAIKNALLSGNSGPTRRPLASLSFLLNSVLLGLNPVSFKVVNIFIHLVNGLLIYKLANLVCTNCTAIEATRNRPYDSKQIALLAAAIWIVHPINVSAVLYSVQRMTLMSALFSLIAIYFYFLAREALYSGKRKFGWSLLATVLLFEGLATISKETGALTPLFILLTEYFLRFRSGRKNENKDILAFLVYLQILPILSVSLVMAANPDFLFDSYRYRTFSASERFLTETRVFFYYLRLIFLVPVTEFGLFHDDFAISRNPLEPISTFAGLIGLLGLVVGAFWCRQRFSLIAFGCMFFMVGHSLESTFLPLEPVFEHRNYLPLFGLSFIMAFGILYAARQLKNKFWRLLLIIVFPAILLGITAIRCLDWSQPVLFAIAEQRNHPNSVRANQQLGELLIARSQRTPEPESSAFRAMAKEYFLTAARKSENITAPLFSLLTNFECDDTVVQFQRRRKLIEQLRDQPFHASSLGWLKLIADDPSSEPCGLNPKFWKPLFEAALSNRSLAGNWKAHVATIAANYYAQSLGDWGRANRLMLDATRADPENPVFYYNHAQLLMTTGKRKIAAALLQRADTLDKLRRYRQASDRLHEQLDRLPT